MVAGTGAEHSAIVADDEGAGSAGANVDAYQRHWEHRRASRTCGTDSIKSSRGILHLNAQSSPIRWRKGRPETKRRRIDSENGAAVVSGTGSRQNASARAAQSNDAQRLSR